MCSANHSSCSLQQPLVSACYCLVTESCLTLTLWTAAYQAPLSFTISRSLLKLKSIESVILSNHLILCHPLLLLPSIFPTIRVFFNKSVLCIRWTKYWSFSFSISPANKYSGLISFRIDWLDLLICSYPIIMYYHNINVLSLSPCCVLY